MPERETVAGPLTEGPRALLLCPWCWNHYRPTASEWCFCSSRCRRQRARARERLAELRASGRIGGERR